MLEKKEYQHTLYFQNMILTFDWSVVALFVVVFFLVTQYLSLTVSPNQILPVELKVLFGERFTGRYGFPLNFSCRSIFTMLIN